MTFFIVACCEFTCSDVL